jgi:hypothetical protein
MASEKGHQFNAAEAPDAALYIASIADELARLAKSYDLEPLAYILDMARLEADQISQHRGGGRVGRGPRAASS